MKVDELIAALQDLDGDTEIYFTSCCYPTTKWFEIKADYDGDMVLEGYAGSYVAGDPDTSPFVRRSV
jgi:hypothetical protein